MYKVIVEYMSGNVEYNFSSLSSAIEAKKFAIANGVYAYILDENGNVLID